MSWGSLARGPKILYRFVGSANFDTARGLEIAKPVEVRMGGKSFVVSLQYVKLNHACFGPRSSLSNVFNVWCYEPEVTTHQVKAVIF